MNNGYFDKQHNNSHFVILKTKLLKIYSQKWFEEGSPTP